MIRLIPFFAVFLVAGLRATTLQYGVGAPPELPALDTYSIDSLGLVPGVTDVEFEHWDPEAVVVVLAGQDGEPGVAGTDDNMNGLADDRLELGATRSDDPCVVLTKGQLADIPKRDVMVLQRGAYIPDAENTVMVERSGRAIVFGTAEDGSPWSLIRVFGPEPSEN